MSESFSIDVAYVNEVTGESSLDGSSVSENATVTTVEALSVVDADAGDSHSFEVSDERFGVVDGYLRLRPGVSREHEDSEAIEVEVTYTDAGGMS